MRSFLFTVLLSLFAFDLAGCGPDEPRAVQLPPLPPPAPVVVAPKPEVLVLTDFAEVEVDQGELATTDIVVLNRWLREHPGKVVNAVSGVFKGNRDNCGYLIGYVPGTLHQGFEVVAANGSGSGNAKILQKWKNEHASLRINSFATVPDSSGGVRAIVVCYDFDFEQKKVEPPQVPVKPPVKSVAKVEVMTVDTQPDLSDLLEAEDVTPVHRTSHR